jgi:hypothetical protein
LLIKRILFTPGNQQRFLGDIVHPVWINSQRPHERTQLLMLLSTHLREFRRNDWIVASHTITLSWNPEV